MQTDLTSLTTGTQNFNIFQTSSKKNFTYNSDEYNRDFINIKMAALDANLSEEEAINLIDEIRDTLPMNR